MRVISAGLTNIGNIRERNEDNMFLDGMYLRPGSEPEDALQCRIQNSVHVYAVSDGMGGGNCGDEAALLAVRTLGAHYYNSIAAILAGGGSTVPEGRPVPGDHAGRDARLSHGGSTSMGARLEGYVQAANKRLCAEMDRRSINHMGATVSVLGISDDHAVACNVGDSRIYQFYRGKLTQLSVDHRHPRQSVGVSVLTQHLGIRPEEFLIEPYVSEPVPLEPGMLFLIASDGVTDMVSEQELQELLAEFSEPAGPETPPESRPTGQPAPEPAGESGPMDIAEAVIRAALAAGGRDNATAIVVMIE